MSVKQVIVLRTRFPDGRGGQMGMRTGKIGAQIAHASMKVFFDRAIRDIIAAYTVHQADTASQPDITVEYGPDTLVIPLAPEMAEWVNGRFTKIVVGVETEEDLLRCHVLALEAGLPTALIQDMGATEFKAPCPACEGHGKVGEGCPAPLTLSHKHFGAKAVECEGCGGSGKVGVPTYTTCAIGPAESEEIEKITGPEGAVRVKLL